LGVVVPCYRQQKYLARTLAAIEAALEGREWRGAIVLAAAGGGPMPPLGHRWQLIAPPVARPLTPGASRMLGLAAIEAAWVLFVDADVEVDAAWVAEALGVIERQPSLAGIWGRVEEWFATDDRITPGSKDMFQVGDTERAVEYMTTPVFYRRAALLDAGGYDPRLRSEEDFELGLRFGQLGHRLISLGRLAGRHWSAPRPSFGELTRRWSSGLCFGSGQVLRLYAGRPGFYRLLRRQSLYLATLAMWALGLPAAAFAVAGFGGVWLARWSIL